MSTKLNLVVGGVLERSHLQEGERMALWDNCLDRKSEKKSPTAVRLFWSVTMTKWRGVAELWTIRLVRVRCSFQANLLSRLSDFFKLITMSPRQMQSSEWLMTMSGEVKAGCLRICCTAV